MNPHARRHLFLKQACLPFHHSGDRPGAIRTHNPRIQSPVLCPLSYEPAGREGFEPPRCGFGDHRSTSWSYRPFALPPILRVLRPEGFSGQRRIRTSKGLSPRVISSDVPCRSASCPFHGTTRTRTWGGREANGVTARRAFAALPSCLKDWPEDSNPGAPTKAMNPLPVCFPRPWTRELPTPFGRLHQPAQPQLRAIAGKGLEPFAPGI